MKAILAALYRAELRFVAMFSHWSQSPHWFMFWVLYFFVWTIFRQLHAPGWYTDQIDLLVITWSSAVLPFWVENSVKVSQGAQLQLLAEHQQTLAEHQQILAQQQRMLTEQMQMLSRSLELSIDIGTKAIDALQDLKATQEAMYRTPQK